MKGTELEFKSLQYPGAHCYDLSLRKTTMRFFTTAIVGLVQVVRVISEVAARSLDKDNATCPGKLGLLRNPSVLVTTEAT